jgi:Transposase DNA-binding
VKNGTIHSGKPKWTCKDCQRQFVATPTQRRITDEIKQTIDTLLLERSSLAGIVRVTGVSLLTITHIFGKTIRMASCDTNAAYNYTVSTTVWTVIGVGMIEQVDAGWSVHEFHGGDLGDERLNRRRLTLAETFGAQPTAPINQARNDG